jgi:hypothetical protein
MLVGGRGLFDQILIAVRSRSRGPALPTLALGAILVASLLMLLAQGWADSLTGDEGLYIQGGVCALTTRVVDLEPSNPHGFQVLDGIGAQLLGPSSARYCDHVDPGRFFAVGPPTMRRLILAARVPAIVATLVLTVIVFVWTLEFLGGLAALVAAGLTALEPTVLAHGHLATADMPVTVAIVAGLWAYWKWIHGNRKRWLVLLSLALTWGLLSKLTAFALIAVIVPLELLLTPGRVRARVLRATLLTAAVGVVAYVLVCCFYWQFRWSQSWRTFHSPLGILYPGAWLRGVAFQLRHVHEGHTGYLNGQLFDGRGPWLYIPEAILLKTTLGLLVLTVLAAVWTARRRDTQLALHVWWPMGAITALAVASGIDIGVRYVLPIFPLMAIAAASLVRATPVSRPVGEAGAPAAVSVMPRFTVRRSSRLTLATLALVIVAIGAGLLRFPQDIGYFNALARGSPERYLVDSNLDWGQDAWRLRDWSDAHGRPRMSTVYFGTLPLSDYGITANELPTGDSAAPGLLAASVHEIAEGRLRGRERQLGGRAVLARLGTSILVFGPPSRSPNAPR